MSSPAAPDPAQGDAAVAAAHRAMVEAGRIQLDLPGAAAPPTPPDWLTDFLQWLAERPIIFKFVFWAGVAVIAALVVKLIYDHVSAARLRFRSEAPTLPGEGWWRPEAGAVRALLAEADALAAGGRYAEAAHLLLLRSVEDIGSRRPGEVRPSLTAREIARLSALPADVRMAFGQIAGVVETSLFGGGAVAREAWERARGAYAGLAGFGAWGTA